MKKQLFLNKSNNRQKAEHFFIVKHYNGVFTFNVEQCCLAWDSTEIWAAQIGRRPI